MKPLTKPIFVIPEKFVQLPAWVSVSPPSDTRVSVHDESVVGEVPFAAYVMFGGKMPASQKNGLVVVIMDLSRGVTKSNIESQKKFAKATYNEYLKKKPYTKLAIIIQRKGQASAATAYNTLFTTHVDVILNNIPDTPAGGSNLLQALDTAEKLVEDALKDFAPKDRALIGRFVVAVAGKTPTDTSSIKEKVAEMKAHGNSPYFVVPQKTYSAASWSQLTDKAHVFPVSVLEMIGEQAFAHYMIFGGAWPPPGLQAYVVCILDLSGKQPSSGPAIQKQFVKNIYHVVKKRKRYTQIAIVFQRNGEASTASVDNSFFSQDVDKLMENIPNTPSGQSALSDALITAKTLLGEYLNKLSSADQAKLMTSVPIVQVSPPRYPQKAAKVVRSLHQCCHPAFIVPTALYQHASFVGVVQDPREKVAFRSMNTLRDPMFASYVLFGTTRPKEAPGLPMQPVPGPPSPSTEPSLIVVILDCSTHVSAAAIEFQKTFVMHVYTVYLKIRPVSHLAVIVQTDGKAFAIQHNAHSFSKEASSLLAKVPTKPAGEPNLLEALTIAFNLMRRKRASSTGRLVAAVVSTLPTNIVDVATKAKEMIKCCPPSLILPKKIYDNHHFASISPHSNLRIPLYNMPDIAEKKFARMLVRGQVHDVSIKCKDSYSQKMYTLGEQWVTKTQYQCLTYRCSKGEGRLPPIKLQCLGVGNVCHDADPSKQFKCKYGNVIRNCVCIMKPTGTLRIKYS